MSELRAIIFDFDGVIADTEPLHFAALQQVLARYRDRPHGGGVLYAITSASMIADVSWRPCTSTIVTCLRRCSPS